MKYTISIDKKLLERLRKYKEKTGLPIAVVIDRACTTYLGIWDEDLPKAE